MQKIRTIIRKEWLEVFQNRLVIFSVAFLPLLMAALPLGILFSMKDAGAASAGTLSSETIPREMAALCPSSLEPGDCLKVYMMNAFMVLFMIIPVVIPGAIAGYSVVGEKTTRSLEPLLATPITTFELLIGKCLAAVIPAVAATFGAFGIFALGAAIILANPALVTVLLDLRWLLAVFVLGPLLAFLAVTFALMVSSRVNDPRVAEQISAVVIIPVMAGFLGQLSGLFVLNREIIVFAALIFLALDGLMFYLATKVFQRESILTRWR
ncbi:MAG: ABC transporter permease [Anaerolineales bacterium]|nr:ABC transporter permease [Anaerolineales bacterium]